MAAGAEVELIRSLGGMVPILYGLGRAVEGRDMSAMGHFSKKIA